VIGNLRSLSIASHSSGLEVVCWRRESPEIILLRSELVNFLLRKDSTEGGDGRELDGSVLAYRHT
jgi:hypothetical protein